MARRLLLLRHGDIGDEYRGRYIGSSDVPLSGAGRRQAEAIALRIRAASPERCLASPLRRCRETAKIVSGATGLRFEIDPDLREINFGAWEGLTFHEIAESASGLVKRWAAFDARFAFPKGEATEDFLSRVRRVADRLAAEPADTLLACTHGGVIRSLVCHFLGLAPWQYILFTIRAASLTTIELFDGKGVLTGLSETGWGGY